MLINAKTIKSVSLFLNNLNLHNPPPSTTPGAFGFFLIFPTFSLFLLNSPKLPQHCLGCVFKVGKCFLGMQIQAELVLQLMMLLIEVAFLGVQQLCLGSLFQRIHLGVRPGCCSALELLDALGMVIQSSVVGC